MPIDAATFTSAGKTTQHFIPGAYSRIDVLAGASGFVSTGNVVLIGSAQGGEPQTLLQFNNLSQALNVLRGGPLYDAMRFAFNPSPDPDLTPQRIFAMRVNNATKAVYNAEVGSTDTVRISSRDWGASQNQMQIKIEANSAASYDGRNVTIKFGGDTAVLTAVSRGMFSIKSSDTNHTLQVTASTLVFAGSATAANNMTITYTNYATVGDLVADLDNQSFLTITAIAGSEDIPLAENTLDIESAANFNTTATVTTANTRELVERVNNEVPFATAERVGAPGKTFAAVTTFTYFTGGGNGSYTSALVDAALTKLEAEDIQFISTPDPDDSSAAISVTGIHGKIKTHCTRMSGTTGRRERQFILGGEWGETVAEAITAARGLNSYLGSYVFNGVTARDANGELKDWDASYQACRLAGLASVLAINEPLTFKSLQGAVLESSLNASQLEMLIRNGVAPIAYDDNGVPHYKRQVTTYQVANKIFQEFSAVREGLFVNRDLRNYVETRVTGRPGSVITTGLVAGMITNRLSRYVEEGIFVGDDQNPPFSNVSVILDGDQFNVDFDAFLTLPVNFTFITSHFRVFVSATTAE